VVESFTKQRGEDMSKKQKPQNYLYAILGFGAAFTIGVVVGASVVGLNIEDIAFLGMFCVLVLVFILFWSWIE
jgi:high-affinity Fe2+/Pb2+ permease